MRNGSRDAVPSCTSSETSQSETERGTGTLHSLERERKKGTSIPLFASPPLSVPGLTSQSHRSPVMVTSPDSAPSSSIYAPTLHHFSGSGCSLSLLHRSPHLSFCPPNPPSYHMPTPPITPPSLKQAPGLRLLLLC